MQVLRRPLFLIALALLALAVLAELGSLALVPGPPAAGRMEALVADDPEMREALGKLSPEERRTLREQPKPHAITAGRRSRRVLSSSSKRRCKVRT